MALGVLATFAGAMLGYLCIFIESLTVRSLGHPSLFNDIAAMIVGGILGMSTAPILVLLCYDRDLRRALVMVYLTGAAVVVVTTVLGDPVRAVVFGFIAVGTASIAARSILPQTVKRPRLGRCGWCGYDVAGGGQMRCPECGRECDPELSDLIPGSGGIALGETTLFRVVTGNHASQTGFWCAIIGLVCLFSVRYLLPHFSVGRFERVQVDWTEREVRRLLGRPDSVSHPTPVSLILHYEVPNFLIPDCYDIEVEQGRVTGKVFQPG